MDRRQKNSKAFWTIVWMLTLLYTFSSYLTEHIHVGGASFRPAVALLAVAAAIYGSWPGFIIGFFGNFGVDVLNNSYWVHWSLANGMIGLTSGLLHLVPGYRPERGEIGMLHIWLFFLFTAVGNYAGLILAGIIDIWLINEPFDIAVIRAAMTPATVNILCTIVLGGMMLYGYGAIKRRRLTAAERAGGTPGQL